jgi:acyl carrier protein
MLKYENDIREIIVNLVQVTVPIADIGIETDLQTIGMDSISFINIVTSIEDEFSILFPDEKLIMSESSTIRDLCEIVEKAISEGKDI